MRKPPRTSSLCTPLSDNYIFLWLFLDILCFGFLWYIPFLPHSISSANCIINRYSCHILWILSKYEIITYMIVPFKYCQLCETKSYLEILMFTRWMIWLMYIHTKVSRINILWSISEKNLILKIKASFELKMIGCF